jgi:uncharacterized protein YdhG (YjbR/CyaY superfamily)
MTGNKPDNIDEYIAGFSPEVQAILEQVRQTIHQTVPEAKETIKYDMPTFTLEGNLVHFAAFKKHLGFYPIPMEHPDFIADFAPYKQGKGSIQFPLDQPMPLELIAKVVRYRVGVLKKV